LGSLAAAETSASSEEGAIETIAVVTSPLPGIAIDRDKIPTDVQTFTATDLAREGTSSLVQTLADRASSVNISSTLGDDFQLDIFYRGFTTSPVLGTPEGIAVYQNGTRINEAFGDTINWDLIPDIAIDRLDLVSSNPV
jgi:iron complex outermembrane receptor protein